MRVFIKKEHSKALLISAIIGVLYSFYIISYFFSGIAQNSGAQQVGASLATAIAKPHMFLVILATIFNWVAYFH